jgi:ATP-dependent Clp endopeptidase proteolytic subunit ClpP
MENSSGTTLGMFDSYGKLELIEEKNTILFYTEVDINTVTTCKKHLKKLADKIRKSIFNQALSLNIELDSKRWKQFYTDMIKHSFIRLEIDSPGGAVCHGLGLFDAIKNCSIPVHVHVNGIAASMGSILGLSGKRRTASPNSIFLLHKIRGGFKGRHQELLDAVYNWELMNKMLVKIYVDNSNLSAEEVEKLMNDEKEMSAQEALRYGLIDEIV